MMNSGMPRRRLLNDHSFRQALRAASGFASLLPFVATGFCADQREDHAKQL